MSFDKRWPMECHLASLKEGWVLTNDSQDNFLIAKVDDPPAWTDKDGKPMLDYEEPKFEWDEDALKFVKSIKKKPHAAKALQLHGKKIPSGRWFGFDVPTAPRPDRKARPNVTPTVMNSRKQRPLVALPDVKLGERKLRL